MTSRCRSRVTGSPLAKPCCPTFRPCCTSMARCRSWLCAPSATSPRPRCCGAWISPSHPTGGRSRCASWERGSPEPLFSCSRPADHERHWSAALPAKSSARLLDLLGSHRLLVVVAEVRANVSDDGGDLLVGHQPSEGRHGLLAVQHDVGRIVARLQFRVPREHWIAASPDGALAVAHMAGLADIAVERLAGLLAEAKSGAQDRVGPE